MPIVTDKRIVTLTSSDGEILLDENDGSILVEIVDISDPGSAILPQTPYGIKWARKRHHEFIAAERQRLIEENQLSEVARAEREINEAKTFQDITDGIRRLDAAHSVEYVAQLWKNYEEKRGRN